MLVLSESGFLLISNLISKNSYGQLEFREDRKFISLNLRKFWRFYIVFLRIIYNKKGNYGVPSRIQPF